MSERDGTGTNLAGKTTTNGKLGVSVSVNSVIPKHRHELLKWNGWGYKDTKFYTKDAVICFTGDRYPLHGSKLQNFTKWALDTLNVDVTKPISMPRPLPSENEYPPSRIDDDVLYKIKLLNIPYSLQGIERLFRCHGHTCHDIYTLRNGLHERIPDLVVWPNNHEDVVKLVKFADEYNLVVIPFGGGTAVSGAVECPKNETRPIISLDTSQMNKILWVDRDNLVACFESGIIGQDLERELKKLGYTSGHEPDSYEFSSLGGWVATRASGMKKNVYGNIEDLLVHVKIVTPKGVLEKGCQVPRMSCGPDFNHIIIGSEGSFGVITEVVLKIRPLPECKRYGSIVFPTFEDGFNCMRDIAFHRCQPASIRLMDNDQFKFGHSLKPESSGLSSLTDGFKKLYLTKWKGFDLDKICAMTLLFEGEKREVDIQEKRIYEIGAKHGGLKGGSDNGERGYVFTFVIAYIRDLAFDYNIVSESFETSVPWDRSLNLIRNVKQCIKTQCSVYKIQYYLICCRVTQTYDAGCVIYFYFAFNYEGMPNPVEIYEKLEEKARDEIVASGGSISHHHGVGKIRKKWYAQTVSNIGVELFKAAKRELDPNNIFATDNLIQSKL